VSSNGALQLAAATVALFLAGAPGAATGSAAGRAGAGSADAGVAKRGAASTGWAARHRCHRPAQRRRRAACKRMRVRRLARDRGAAERLVGSEPAPRSLGGGAPSGGADPGPVATPPALGRFVSVAAREWSLTLSRPVVGAGSVTVELRNAGEDPHNLVLSPYGTHVPLSTWAETEPGAMLRQPVALGAGEYLLWCSLDGHEAAGMSVRLRVE
jgi:hypothetical protein